MGRLVGLELHNFKSYKGTSTIGFGTSCFTSIIGPNGAGKSNMMDAISFVLGIQSSQLRSANMKDLIYRGRREDTELQDASLDVVDVNPTKAYVEVIYEKDDGDRIELKRIINANGSTEYKINDRVVTALHYSTVLKNENILIKARNFLVFQGDVELIASQSPKDLTKLIETISGSNEYAKQFEELKEEMDKAHEFANSVFSRKRNLNSESKQYKEQMLEQETFERKLTDKSNLIKIIYLYKLYHNELKHDQMSETLEGKNKHLRHLKRQLATQEKQYSDLISEYSNQCLQGKQSDSQISDLLLKVENTKREIIPLNANQRALSNKINSTSLKIKDITNDIKSQQLLINTTTAQLKEAKKLYKVFEDKVNSSISSSIPPEAHKEYDELRSEYLANGGSELEEKLSLLFNEKDSLNANIKNNQEQLSNFKNSIRELQHLKEGELALKLDAINTEINELLSIKDEKSQLKNLLIKEKENFNHKELKLNSELKDLLIRLDDLSSRQRESNKQKKQRENLSMLKNLLPDGAIKGFVHELIRPSQQKYDQALMTLLGRNFDSIIVETTSVAYKCIEILKERRTGVFTFLPLDSISSEPMNLNYLRSIHPQAQPGVDIVETDDSALEQAVQYVIGDALVVNNIDTARQLKWNSNGKLENKIVTLDGSIINRSGLMTGGLSSQKSQLALSWDKNEFNKLIEMKDDLVKELLQIGEQKPKEMEINLISESILELDDKLPLLRTQKETVERQISDKETEISYHNESIARVTTIINDKKSGLAKVDKQISDIDKRVDEIQAGIFAEFCSKYEFRNGIKDYEEVHGAAMRVKAKERSQFLKSISTLTNKLNFDTESLEETKARKKNLEKDLKHMETKLQEIIGAKETAETKLDELEAQLEVLQQDKTSFDRSLQEKLKFASHVEAEINDFKTEIDSMNKSITTTEEAILKVDIARVNILKNCKIENTIIPLMDGLLEQISLNDSVDALAKTTYDIAIDYSMLTTRLKDTFSERIEAELQAKLSQVMEELDQLTPNSKASERLKETETRLRDFDRDFTKARQRESKVIEKFNEVKNKRHELFTEAFEHISNKIDPVYKELTKTSASPLGGSAYLSLEDEDEPYSAGIKYHAMPPMKRFRDMELLSGGEKTIAALALLFAVHSYQPSPFFVLDEVDAALDASNVNRIANYIKGISSPSFQFIVISLKNTLFEKSDALVGIYREQTENSSRTVTLDLRDYPDEETPIVGATA